MADPRFFDNAGPFELGYLANALGCKVDRAAQSIRISAVGPLKSADGECLSFLANRKYRPDLLQTKAGAVLVYPSDAGQVPKGTVALVSQNPYYDFARAAQIFHPDPVPEPRIHPQATVSDSAEIGDGVCIEAGARIGPNSRIGPGAWIQENAVVDRGVTIGEGTWLGSGAYAGYCDIGRHCRIHPGVRIGTRGFGFAMSASGHTDIPQTGIVTIGDFVEIGANSTVDRGMGQDTVLGDGTKIDNLVQIGHNVQVGKGCVITAQSGIAGSTVLGDFVVMGAQSGVAGHLRIGAGTQIAAKCGVIRNLEPGEKVGGLPAVPLRRWLRQHAFLEKLMEKKGDKPNR